jgi:hypothetical protein
MKKEGKNVWRQTGEAKMQQSLLIFACLGNKRLGIKDVATFLESSTRLKIHYVVLSTAY